MYKPYSPILGHICCMMIDFISWDVLHTFHFHSTSTKFDLSEYALDLNSFVDNNGIQGIPVQLDTITL